MLIGLPMFVRLRKSNDPSAMTVAEPSGRPVVALRAVTVLPGTPTPMTLKSPVFHVALVMLTVSTWGVITTSSFMVVPPTVTANWKVSGWLVLGNTRNGSTNDALMVVGEVIVTLFASVAPIGFDVPVASCVQA